MKLMPGWAHMNPTAWCGLMAQRISGWVTMCETPSTAIVKNQMSVTGPKNLPMPLVPRFCTANRQNSTTSVSGITYCLKWGETTSSPSTADSTEMAGVMTPSP
jgi:hypothetical protein